MAVADTKNSIVVTKRFTYRGADKEFTNRYHFEGALPADDAAWTTFADAVVADEKLVYGSEVRIIKVDGYDASTASSTNPHGDAVFTKTYSVAGTGTFADTGVKCPGDCAAFVRYGTTARSTKNHPVYLSNYYHGVYSDTGGGDDLLTAQLAALETYQEQWITGYTIGGTSRERCGPRGAVAVTGTVSPVVRHRDFPA